MKKYNSWFAVMGFCAFIALMASGLIWLFSAVGITWGFLGTVRNVAHIVLTVIAVFSGWLWVSSSKMNKTLKLVLEILFVIFAVMAIMGICGVSF